MTKKLNLDVERFIAALMVVAIHVYPLTSINEKADYLFSRVICRIAVPLFLMITGFYILPKALKNKDALKDYTKKIIWLYLISMVIYLPLMIKNSYFTNINVLTILKDIFITGTFYHLWYFPALILGLWLTYYLLKKLNINVVKTIVAILFVLGLMGDSYYGLISHISILNSFYEALFNIFDYTRNGLFYVPIFLVIGYLFTDKKSVLSTHKNIILLIIFFILMLIEGMMLYHFNIPRHTSMYIFLIPVSYYLFMLLLKYNNGTNKSLRNLSTWIYILHPLFIAIIYTAARILHLNIFVDNSLLNYLLVIISTTVFILIVNKIIKLVRKN